MKNAPKGAYSLKHWRKESAPNYCLPNFTNIYLGRLNPINTGTLLY